MTKSDLCKRLFDLSQEMIQLGVDMQDYGDDSEIERHGIELVGAGKMAESWTDWIELDVELDNK